MSAEIVDFPGTTSLDIAPDRVLEKAQGKLVSVVVVGWDTEDNLFIAASLGALAEVLYLLEMAKKTVLEIESPNRYF